MKAVEVITTEKLGQIKQGTLIRLIGQHWNGVELAEEGIVHNPFNGTITLMSQDEGGTIWNTWISLDPKSERIVCKDYMGSPTYSEISPDQHQELLNVWNNYQK